LCGVTSVPSSPAERFDAGALERVLVEIEAANGATFGDDVAVVAVSDKRGDDVPGAA
jgi:hypothetical protein